MKKIYYLYAWLFGRPAFTRVHSLLFSLALRGMGVFNYANTRVSGENWFIRNVVKKLGAELIVFDVGANVGGYTQELIREGVKAKQIFAFEPHPASFKKLQAIGLSFPQVVPVNVALASQNGAMTLFDRSDGDGTPHASLSPEIFSEIYHIEKISTMVRAETLDGFCAQKKITLIDFIKIDVEGFELDVLMGAKTMLSMRKIKAIQFEFTQLNAVVGVFFKQIYDLLSPNYDLYRLLPHGMQEISKYDPIVCEIYGYQNFVAILRCDID